MHKDEKEKKGEFDLKNYYFELPEELIAQTPVKQRDKSKLLTINRTTDEIQHQHFTDIKSYLKKGDVLVVNKSKVFPARIYGYKPTKKESLIEFLLIERKTYAHATSTWEVMVKPGKKAKVGDIFCFGENSLMSAKILEIHEDGNRTAEFTYSSDTNDFFLILEKIGTMPLPPYIKEKLSLTDSNRYQTVYAEDIGSVAAPTAGLHFTDELIEEIKDMGVKIAPIILHVGLGTFKPVKVNNIIDHKMHSEYFSIPQSSANIINNAKKNANKIVAVGTTSCRTLEANTDENGMLKYGDGKTDIFIYGNYKFKTVDALITNFHLPESTLLMLISAFYDREKILDIYKNAVENEYRFFSFGDAMFLY